jgi:glutamate--cysteine ligase
LDHEKKVQLFVEYFRRSEVDPGDRKLGLELEHLVVEKDSLTAASYYEEGGIEDLLLDLSEFDWEPVNENGHVVGMEADRASLTLEPGGQVEISIDPEESLSDLEDIYLGFLEKATSILDRRGKRLLALGYQPETRIEDIKILPKERYDHMYDYFENKGEYAHNMMKGTGAVHVNVDYANELDYVKKNAVANFLTPVIYGALDNSPFFQGRIHEVGSLRATIWNNCDPDRCGYPDGVFDGRFGYQDYAEYLLEVPVMVYRKDGELFYDGKKRVKDVVDEDLTEGELEYLLSTVFPDVRTKGHLEIRMGDSLPLPYSMAYAALWKGLLYDRENLDFLHRRCNGLDPDEYRGTLQKVRQGSESRTEGDGGIFSFYRELIKTAENGLPADEERYLEPLKRFAEEGVTPKSRTLNRLDEGKAEALSWCDVKKGLEDRLK